MGSKHRDAIFRRSDGKCIYCGGQNAATTVDHMPPVSMFNLKQRPRGLEFASCASCNNEAGITDLVCATIGRAYPDPSTPEELMEVKKYFAAVANNIPALLQEMQVSSGKQRRKMARLGLDEAQGGLLNVSGPIARSHLEAFGARLGFAMHFNATGTIVGPSGGSMVRVYSNLDLMNDVVPAEVFELLPSPQTITSGVKSVEDQFRYGATATDDRRMSMTYAVFRRSFALLVATSVDSDLSLTEGIYGGARFYRPGKLKGTVPLSYHSSTAFVL